MSRNDQIQPAQTISIAPSADEAMRVVDQFISDGDYFTALHLAISFEGPDALTYARDVAERCAKHREAHPSPDH